MGPLSSTARTRCSGADECADRNWAMQREALPAMQGLGPGNRRFGLGDPQQWPAKRHADAGYGALIAAFVHVGQFVRIERIVAHAKAERVKGAIAPIVGLADRRRQVLILVCGEY